jgi:GGDEF domain-containing protein
MADEESGTGVGEPGMKDEHLQIADDAGGASVAETLGLLAERLALALGCWECCIYEYLAKRDAVLPRTIWSRELSDDDRAYVGVENHLNRQPHVAPVFAEHRVVVTQVDAEVLDPQSRESMAYWGEKTALYAPVLNGEELLGVIELVETRERREFSESDLRLVLGLADVAAVAIVNARLYDRLQIEAITDGLTGLFNHRHFYERLNAEITRSRRYGLHLSLLMLDLDDFKKFNDEFGHQAGDRVLAEVGRIMREQLRKDVDIPCRYGGEEFAVILPHTPSPGAETVGRRLTASVTAIVGADGKVDPAWLAGERVRQTIEGAPFPGAEPDQSTHITVSVGAATYPEQAGDADSLVGNTDKALYVAKHRGKNRVELFS